MKIIEEAKECALNGIALNKEQIIKLLENIHLTLLLSNVCRKKQKRLYQQKVIW